MATQQPINWVQTNRTGDEPTWSRSLPEIETPKMMQSSYRYDPQFYSGTLTMRPGSGFFPSGEQEQGQRESIKEEVRVLGEDYFNRQSVIHNPLFGALPSISYLLRTLTMRPGSGFFPSGEQEQGQRESIKGEVRALLEGEIGAEFDGAAAPEAVEYAHQLIDQFPADCFALPAPDVSATEKGGVYFEWMLEKDGLLLLTVDPDGTVAYVCTYGTARSKNFGAWEDQIADLIAPCFAKLAQIQEKDR